jgi:hypothetical protein
MQFFAVFNSKPRKYKNWKTGEIITKAPKPLENVWVLCEEPWHPWFSVPILWEPFIETKKPSLYCPKDCQDIAGDCVFDGEDLVNYCEKHKTELAARKIGKHYIALKCEACTKDGNNA